MDTAEITTKNVTIVEILEDFSFICFINFKFRHAMNAFIVWTIKYIYWN